MSSSPFNDPQLDAAWNAFAEEDRRLAPAPALEAQTFARCQRAVGAKDARGTRVSGSWLAAAAGLATAASVAAAVFLSQPRTEPTVLPIEARALGVTMLADAVSAERPAIAVKTARRKASTPPAPPARATEPVELAEVLMQFDLAPMRAHEPLQMVRLRLPREALQALGLALLEPDARGLVDVDVLVGEDGLPRDIRKVRIGQE